MNHRTMRSPHTVNFLHLWDVVTGKEIKTLSGYQERVRRDRFSRAGKTLASAGEDNRVKLWNLDLDNLMTLGCDWVRVYLTSNPNASASQKQACGITSKK